MFTPFIIILIAALSAVLQIAFLSQFGFPWATVSFPLIAIAYGSARGRPILALGWALIAGILLDLHGLLGFGAELAALIAAFFASDFLFRRVLTNAGGAALFLLGAIVAVVHWSVLAAIDGVRVLFGAMPVMIELSASSLLAPLRQGLVNGVVLLAVVALEAAVRTRYRKTFLTHGTSPYPLS